MTITKNRYVQNILEKYGRLGYHSMHTPEYRPELSKKQPEDKLLGAKGIEPYQSPVGSVLYLAQVTRYDNRYAVNQLSRA